MITRACSVVLLLLGLLGCDREEAPRDRCPRCGMFVDLSPRWNAGLADASGTSRVFDTPKCMLRYAASETGATGVWVTEYYSQERRPLDSVQLVRGSDVIGPMGPDLVPIEAGRAPRFVADHGGQALTPDAVTPAALEALDGR